MSFHLKFFFFTILRKNIIDIWFSKAFLGDRLHSPWHYRTQHCLALKAVGVQRPEFCFWLSHSVSAWRLASQFTSLTPSVKWLCLGCILPLAPSLNPKGYWVKTISWMFQDGWKVHSTPSAAALTEKFNCGICPFSLKCQKVTFFPDISWVFGTQMLISHNFHLRISGLVSVELLFSINISQTKLLVPSLQPPSD